MISEFGKARMKALKEARDKGHFLINGDTPWTKGPWNVQNGEHYTECTGCSFEMAMFEENGTVQTRYYARVDAGTVNDIATMPNCEGNS